MIQRFANPGRFLALANALLPWLWGVAFALLALGLYAGALRLARRLPAGRDGAHHVCPCAGGLDGA